jgi:hypothetical protein
MNSRFNMNSSMTPSFALWTNERVISLAHALVHVTDFSVVNVHVDELLSARIWQHKLCATYSADVNINNLLPIKVYYRISTLRHIRIGIIHGSQNVFWVLSWVKMARDKILISANPCYNSGFHDLFLNFYTQMY